MKQKTKTHGERVTTQKCRLGPDPKLDPNPSVVAFKPWGNRIPGKSYQNHFPIPGKFTDGKKTLFEKTEHL